MNSTIVPTFEDVALAKESSRLLAGAEMNESSPLRVEVDGKMVPLPAKLAKLLKDTLVNLAKGRAVTMVPVEQEITPQEAAELLNVSRPYASRLFDEGAFPSRRVGTHRRALAADVLSYKDRQKAPRLATLDELAAEGQNLGL